MILFFDKSSSRLVFSAGSAAITKADVTSGGLVPIELGFLEGAQIVSLPFTGRQIWLGVVAPGGTVIAVITAWDYDTKTRRYRGFLNLNTNEAATAIGSLKELECSMQVIWRADGHGPFPSSIARLIVKRSVIDFDSTTPIGLPTPEEWAQEFFGDLPLKSAVIDSDQAVILDNEDGNTLKRVTFLAVWNYIATKLGMSFLRFDAPQSLTAPQKAQVLSNAGAAPIVHSHAINDVSGLSDALDGLSTVASTKVNRSGDTMTGLLIMGPSGGTIAGPTGSPGLSVDSTNSVSSAAWLRFRRTTGNFSIRFGVDSDNKLKWGGGTLGEVSYEIYHQENYKTIPGATLIDPGLMTPALIVEMNSKAPLESPHFTGSDTTFTFSNIDGSGLRGVFIRNSAIGGPTALVVEGGIGWTSNYQPQAFSNNATATSAFAVRRMIDTRARRALRLAEAPADPITYYNSIWVAPNRDNLPEDNFLWGEYFFLDIFNGQPRWANKRTVAGFPSTVYGNFIQFDSDAGAWELDSRPQFLSRRRWRKTTAPTILTSIGNWALIDQGTAGPVNGFTRPDFYFNNLTPGQMLWLDNNPGAIAVVNPELGLEYVPKVDSVVLKTGGEMTGRLMIPSMPGSVSALPNAIPTNGLEIQGAGSDAAKITFHIPSIGVVALGYDGFNLMIGGGSTYPGVQHIIYHGGSFPALSHEHGVPRLLPNIEYLSYGNFASSFHMQPVAGIPTGTRVRIRPRAPWGARPEHVYELYDGGEANNPPATIRPSDFGSGMPGGVRVWRRISGVGIPTATYANPPFANTVHSDDGIFYVATWGNSAIAEANNPARPFNPLDLPQIQNGTFFALDRCVANMPMYDDGVEHHIRLLGPFDHMVISHYGPVMSRITISGTRQRVTLNIAVGEFPYASNGEVFLDNLIIVGGTCGCTAVLENVKVEGNLYFRNFLYAGDTGSGGSGSVSAEEQRYSVDFYCCILYTPYIFGRDLSLFTSTSRGASLDGSVYNYNSHIG